MYVYMYSCMYVCMYVYIVYSVCMYVDKCLYDLISMSRSVEKKGP